MEYLTMKKQNYNLIKAAFITAGLSSVAMPAYAQEADKDEKQVEEVEVINVKGFRRSVVESMNTKRFSTNVVDAISAEDIGKLPDSSIAESISRLPGLTSQRLDGRASRVSIRGFGENESATTFNGREQVSIGDNRGVEFDLYPSEIMSGVTVYKTPNASLEAEGIAGVIDMQTVSPLAKGERVVSIGGQYESSNLGKLNPDGDDAGYRFTASMIDQFADDTVGVAIAVNIMESPNQEKRWNSWGFPDFNGEGKMLGGAKPFVRSSMLNRDSVMAVFEYQPNDRLNATFDALYVDFKDEKILRGIEIPFAWGNGSTKTPLTVDEATGFITSAVTENQDVVVRNDYEERAAKLNNFGLNLTYDVSDDLTVEFDASSSKVEREIYSFESYAGTGRGDAEVTPNTIQYTMLGGNTGAIFTPSLDYSDYDLIKMGGPLSWGWSSALNEKFVTGNPDAAAYENAAQDGFLNAPLIDDELTAIKLAAKQALDSEYFDSVEFGVSQRSRTKEKRSQGWYMTLNSFPDLLVVPEQYRLGTADLSFIGMGDMIAYDSLGMLQDGYYDLTDERLTGGQHQTKSWTVNEDVTAAYVQANIDSQLGGVPVRGNIGLRYVNTEQDSQGTAFQVVDGVVVFEPTDISHSYSNLLPSMNLSFQLDDEQILRAGYAKTISRPRMDEMNASFSAGYNQQPDQYGNYWSIGGGNPALEGKEATGFDLSYENYFAPEGYFSVAYYYKDITSWIFDGTYQVELSGVADPSTGLVPETSTATGSGKINAGEGSLSGMEIALALPFNLLDESLDGFGLLASYTTVDQDLQDQNGNDYSLPGLSDTIESYTAYYDKDGFSARVSVRKRSDFKGDIYGIGFDTQQVDILGETIVDAQVGFDFGEAGFADLDGLSVYLQAQNLTEEPFTSLQGSALEVRDYQDYGSTYLLGFNYKL